jgi:hypothetical protein
MTNDTISNTEVTAFNTCEKMHQYAYDLNIQPRDPKDYIYRGEIGHAALDAYYYEMQEGSALKTCLNAGLQVIAEEMLRVALEEPEALDKIALLTDLTKLIREYSDFYSKEPFKVLAVEEEYRALLYPGKDYMMRLDLLVEYTSGEFRGDIVLMDHKFSYNFKTVTELELDGQLPKFIKTLKANNYTISKGFFNQLRYRKDAKEKFQRTRVPTNSTAMENIWNEQKKAAKRIADRDPFDSRQDPLRVMNPFICKNCWYATLCKAELNGEDTTQMVQANFKQRDRPFKMLEGV